MTVEARELYSRMVSGSRTPFRANAHRARAERTPKSASGPGVTACFSVLSSASAAARPGACYGRAVALRRRTLA
jgi:hypothetical protein